MAAIKALEQWCRTQCEGYRDLSITNMTTSFKNGLAFCAIIHKFRPDLIEYDALNKEDVFKNNNLAFRVAEEQLGIPALLDAEDMVALRIPDRLSILTYVSQYHNYFRGKPPIGGVGGIKRPAEGSKEEPSEKKNLPVVAKTFVSKTAVENRPPPSLAAETSPKLSRAAAEKSVLTESWNKSGTLNSRCAACETHVHLVQRHFVEGKLYHRSCFKCSECSSILLTGAYEAGKEPGTFVCSAHQRATSGSVIRIGPPLAVGRTDAPRHSSVLSAPVTTLTDPVHQPWTDPAPLPWTTSAQKTHAARLKFFQSAPVALEVSSGRSQPPLEVPRKETVPLGPQDQKSGARLGTVNKLAEENRNNNNTRPFVIRSSERRFGESPGLSGAPCWRQTTCSKSAAAQPASSRTCSRAAPWLKAVRKEGTTPTTGSAFTKDSAGTETPIDWRSRLRPVKNGPGLHISGSPEAQSISVEKPSSGVMSVSSPDRTIRTINPPSPDRTIRTINPPSPDRTIRTISPPSPDRTIRTINPPSPDRTIRTISPPSPDRTIRTISPPSPRPPVGPVSWSSSGPAWCAAPSPQLLPRGSGGQGPKNGSCPRSSCSVRPPSSPAPPPLVPVWHRPASPEPQRPSAGRGSKNGKNLSPTNASRSEMRSPSSKSLHVPLEEVVKELSDIEASLADLEREGVEMEKMLRSCEEDVLMDPLMVDWFNLIRKKQMFIRRESELVYTAQIQALEEQQPRVEGELRGLLEKPDHLKSGEEHRREGRLMARLVGIVNGRNAIVEGLDQDRRREEEEDQQLNEMIKSLGVRKSKNKRKSSIKKLFRRRSKKLVVE